MNSFVVILNWLARADVMDAGRLTEFFNGWRCFAFSLAVVGTTNYLLLFDPIHLNNAWWRLITSFRRSKFNIKLRCLLMWTCLFSNLFSKNELFQTLTTILLHHRFIANFWDSFTATIYGALQERFRLRHNITLLFLFLFYRFNFRMLNHLRIINLLIYDPLVLPLVFGICFHRRLL